MTIEFADSVLVKILQMQNVQTYPATVTVAEPGY